MPDPRYDVLTWDHELQSWTPHDGLDVRSQGVTILGVRRVLRILQREGYGCNYRQHDRFNNDPSVLVDRCD